MVENAKIRNTFLGIEDHGILTAFLHLEGDGWDCSFGGYSLDQYDKEKDKRVGYAFGSAFILAVLHVLEVDSWEKLPGKTLRVEWDSPGAGRMIKRIGHLIKDKWFDPKELSAEY